MHAACDPLANIIAAIHAISCLPVHTHAAQTVQRRHHKPKVGQAGSKPRQQLTFCWQVLEPALGWAPE